jgi:hypothetical protein
MRTTRLAAVVVSLVALAGCGGQDDAAEAAEGSATPAAAPAPAVDPNSDEGKIASALAAAPAQIASGAAVMEIDSAGAMKELKAGTNGWLCMPDMANTPGKDPMCADKAWQDWFGAYMAKTPPKVSGIGIAYMLQGGSDASNTDPFATGPAAGAEWVDSGPHMMVLPTNVSELEAYGTDPKAGGPYVMWKGTPYAHLMVPVVAKP